MPFASTTGVPRKTPVAGPFRANTVLCSFNKIQPSSYCSSLYYELKFRTLLLVMLLKLLNLVVSLLSSLHGSKLLNAAKASSLCLRSPHNHLNFISPLPHPCVTFSTSSLAEYHDDESAKLPLSVQSPNCKLRTKSARLPFHCTDPFCRPMLRSLLLRRAF